jgi:hypothetical protein
MVTVMTAVDSVRVVMVTAKISNHAARAVRVVDSAGNVRKK